MKVNAGSSIPPGDVLSEALDAWIYRDDHTKLERLYRDRPDLFRQVDKGGKFKTLYRVLSLSHKALKTLLSRGEIPNREGLESWSGGFKGLQYFADHDTEDGAYAALLKRAVPMSERVICIPCLGESPAIRDDDSRVSEEREVICRRLPVKKEWVFKIVYKGENLSGTSVPKEELEKQLSSFGSKVAARYRVS